MFFHSETLASPRQVGNALLASDAEIAFVKQSRLKLQACLCGEDQRQILIVGPCSIHDIDAALEYAKNLQTFSKEVSSCFFIVMRTYFEKARTKAGWKGFLYDPYLDGTHAIAEGIKLTRQLLLDLAKLEVPVAAEFLDPLAAPYFQDLITWGGVGARTCSSQIHRQMAAALPMPIGFKNSIEGDIEPAINGVLAAIAPHSFLGINSEGFLTAQRAQGNKDSHIVLRGGKKGPNFSKEHISLALNSLKDAQLPPRLLVDCSHGNVESYKEQAAVFRTVLDQIISGNDSIRGMLLESNLFAGSQKISRDFSKLKYGISITDPCIDWKTTKELILSAAELLSSPYAVATGS